MKKQVFVVIVNFNGGEKTLASIESVKKYSVVVVDNRSRKSSLDALKAQGSRLKNLILIENKENLGFAGGANVGIKKALKEGAEYVMLLNQDAIIKSNAVEKLVNIMGKDKRIGICGPLILAPNKKIWSAGGVVDKKRYSAGHLFKILNKNPYQVDFVSGCCMMIKKEVFEKIGFFDERFFLYYEDVDLCIRAQKAGFKVVLVPKTVVYHQVQDGGEVRQYFMARNHLLFLEKHGPLKIKAREMVRLPKTIYEHLNRGETYALLGVRDYFFAGKLRLLRGLQPGRTL